MKLLPTLVGATLGAGGQTRWEHDGLDWEQGENHIRTDLQTCGWHGPLARGSAPDQDRVIDPDRVIGGKDAAHGSWPWIVGFTENGQRVCAGTIIHDRWVISAEHCLPQHIAKDRDNGIMTLEDYPNIKYTKMYFGDHNKRNVEDSEFFLTPQKLVFRTDRSPGGRLRDTTAADIVLIQVESISQKVASIPASNGFVKPACLPKPGIDEDSVDPYALKHCWIAGWGYTRFGETWWGMGGSKLATVLQEAGISIFPNAYCAEKSHMTLAATQDEVTSSAQLQTYNEFCAGIADRDGDGQIDGGIDACSGDSGGPLICEEDGKAVLVGITSRGKGCAMVDNPGIYTPTWLFKDWIYDTIENHTDEAAPTEQPTTTQPPPPPSDTIVSPALIESILERTYVSVECFKGNGAEHPGKTRAQERNRVKKIAQALTQIRKYIGDSKKTTKCALLSETVDAVNYIDDEDKTNEISAEEVLDLLANPESIEAITEGAMEVVYGGCRPYSNWLRGVVKKLNAVKAWEEKALRGGCQIIEG